MPNHVSHIAKFNGKQEDVDFILDIIKTIEHDEEREWTRHIDFNNIIPQPKSLFLGDLSFKDEKKTRGWNWYDWNRQNWGTKWNAYDTERDGNDIVFDTAWTTPYPVMEKLHEMCKRYNVSCEVTYADEDAGCNTGWYRLGDDDFECNDDGTMKYKEDGDD